MRTDIPQPIRLADYRPPAFLIDQVHLDFDLDPTATRVKATLTIRRNGDHAEPLRLNGVRLKPISVAVDGEAQPASAYVITDEDIHHHGAQRGCSCARHVFLRRLLGLCLPGHRQSHDEAADTAFAVALSLNFATVQPDEAFHQSEADSKAVPCAVARSVKLRKQIEYSRQHFRWNSDSTISHAHDDFIAIARRHDFNASAPIRVFRGVIQQIAENLRQSNRVGV